MSRAKCGQHEPIAFGREIYTGLHQLEGPAASFPFAAQTRDGEAVALVPRLPATWGPGWEPRLAEGPGLPGPWHRPPGTGAGELPCRDGFLADRWAGRRSEGWKEARRKRGHAAINPVESNNVFSSIFS